MEKTLLTPKQFNFLELAQQERSITQRFYLTGGTALTEFYLKHRISHDIDLFTEHEEVNPNLTEGFIKKISPRLKIVKYQPSQFLGLVSFQLIYQDGQELKIDFNYYPFPRIAKGTHFKNLEVDSIYDIAVNKLHTLFMKPRFRDYIDLYCIMKAKNYSLHKLILDAKAKFDWHIDRINLGNQFARVVDFEEVVEMLVPLNREEMEEFFLNLAKSLQGEIFR